ncbi:MAG: DUF5018 domain-containing protein [Nitrospirae bacterium]|nr:DUF5018 domain-containing protein [Nitrospirota bacterium]
MKRTWLYMVVSFLLSAILAAGCSGGGGGGGISSGTSSDDNGVVTPSSKAITAFGIVTPAATGIVNESARTISVIVPYGTDNTALAATFTTTGASVVVGSTVQVTGVTVNNFSTPVVYTVNAADGSTQNYTVTVTVAYRTDKAITSYSISGVAGTIDENAKTISVNLSGLTDVTALTATFATSGTSVTAGGTVQVSGVTKNDFTNPVVYTVTAADGSHVDYTVTVTVPLVLGTPITSPTASPITSFGQTRDGNDTGTINEPWYYRESFPGQANVWEIDGDFSLIDGGDFQFVSALTLTFSDLSSFGSQTYGDLTFYGPLMGTAQGVTVADVSNGDSTGVSPLSGGYSAFLNATSDSRLMQTLNLSGLTGTTTLTWTDSVKLNDGDFTPGYTPSYRVVIRNNAGTELEELYSTTTSISGVLHTANLTAYNGQSIVLSFEERSAPGIGFGTPNLTMIDFVSVKDSVAGEHVTNGGFELGLAGWTTNTPAEVQNMASRSENHDGLDVTRSFYTVPNKLWGRWVDVFENNTPSPITTTVHYGTELGTSGTAIIYDTPSTSSKAITAWDGDQYTRDIGMVFGNAGQVVYQSDDGLANGNGSDMIDFSYTITVPVGGSVAIVNFIILGTYDTSLTAADALAKATEIDNEALRIVNNFWSVTDPEFRDGMTQEQIDAIVNFPH